MLSSSPVRLGFLSSHVCSGMSFYAYAHGNLQGWCLSLPTPPARYQLCLFTVDTIFSHRQFVIIAAFLCSFFLVSQDTATAPALSLIVVYCSASSITTVIMMPPILWGPTAGFSLQDVVLLPPLFPRDTRGGVVHCAIAATPVPDAF